MESKKKTNRGRRGSKRNSEFRGEKPKDTYIELIGEAIEKKDSKRSTLEEIYEYLRQRDEFFRGKYIGWQNSIRHNLSFGGYFSKLPKNSHGKIGKGHLWTCSPKFKSFIEEKQKNLISSFKQKTTKIKSESFNKQIELNKELQDQQQNVNLINNNNSVDEVYNESFCSSNKFINSNNNDLNTEQQNEFSATLFNSNYDLVLFSPVSEQQHQQQQLLQIPKEIIIEENNLLNNYPELNNNLNYIEDYSQSLNSQFTPLFQENQQQQQLFIFSDNENNLNNILNDQHQQQQLIPYFNNYCYWHSRSYIGDDGNCYSYLEALPCINYAQTFFDITDDQNSV